MLPRLFRGLTSAFLGILSNFIRYCLIPTSVLYISFVEAFDGSCRWLHGHGPSFFTKIQNNAASPLLINLFNDSKYLDALIYTLKKKAVSIREQ